jgi:Flp pilus assembly pilin Flp
LQNEKSCSRGREDNLLIRKLFADERGQDLMEYGLLASFISVVALATIKLIGPLFVPLYESVKTALTP